MLGTQTTSPIRSKPTTRTQPTSTHAAKFLTDNAYGPYPHLIVSLTRLVGTCPPPPETPEVPFAIVLPLSGLAIGGFVVWRRQRRAPTLLRS
jgi:hypothetical protein